MLIMIEMKMTWKLVRKLFLLVYDSLERFLGSLLKQYIS